MRRRRADSGYSLIEMVVVLGLIGVVTTLGTVLFHRMSDAWRGTRVRSELDARAHNVFAQMRDDLGSAVPSHLVKQPFRGTDRAVQLNERFYQIPLEDDELSFPSRERNAEGDWTSGTTTYYVKRESGRDELRRIRLDYAGMQMPAVTVAEGVVRFNVEYGAQDGTWTESWEGPEPPRALRISLTLLDPDFGDQITRQAVLPVRVN